MTLAWLASYPKSGNTWTRILLHSYAQDRPMDSRAELQAPDSAVPCLVETFRAGRTIPRDPPRPLTVKTHFLPGAQVQRPYRETTRKVVYLVRDPRDVLLSADRYLAIEPEHRTAYARHFIEHRGVEVFIRLGFGSWPRHLLEWTAPERLHEHFPNAEVSVVRYEDMKRDTVGTLAEMVDFLGIGSGDDPDRVRRAVENSKLSRMKDRERAERRDLPRNAEWNPFFGDGRSGQSLAGYGDEVEEAYRRLLREDESFAGLAERYGYAK
ncbi:sulfotransferase domain-containing protein [Actinomadura algeriensis]|uniref:Sulfotransferase domain-containing protein n=1 Tax=Actinomadura algeriensis TaxID=1679523 RepID=A0ABR9JJD4_9ACTN|nr:sulfotransferase domain-containing protein [Actinomadura algeriensis]MBE1530660.1 hypothetical protein [Actinomadura algeriensis]